MQWITINQPHLKKIIFCNLYRPPQGNANEFCNILHDTLLSINTNVNADFETYILGDFNINYLDHQSPGYRDIKWFEQRTGLSQFITTPTRYSNTNSCIDLIFSNSKSIKMTGVLDLNISDHQLIFITRKHTPKTKTASEFSGSSYINFNEEIFCTRLLDHNWEQLYLLDDVDLAWDFYIEYIKVIIDDMCPLRNFKIKNMKDPWITNEILENIHDKDVLLKIAKRTNEQNDWVLARNARNTLNTDIKNLKADFIQENLETNQGDSKKFWKDVQTILPKKGKTDPRKYIIKNNLDEPIYDTIKAANFMNKYFVNVGPKLAQVFQSQWNFTGIETPYTLNDFNVTEEETLQFCKHININKSSAIDHLSSTILKLAFVTLVSQFTYIINLSFEKSCIPSSWKIATVTPLFKSGDTFRSSNYRPISQYIPLPGKIVEKIVHKRMSEFF